jgi:hypothetical protein
VVIDVLLVATFVSTVIVDILLLDHLACKDKVKRGGGVCFKDCIAEEKGGKECQEAFEVDGAATDWGWGEEGGKIVDCDAVGNVCSTGDNHLHWTNDRLMVNNDGDGCGARSNKASHLVCGAEEVSAKVVGIVVDGDLLCLVCHKEKTVSLIELHHFYIGVGFEVHRAGVTRDVLVARLVHFVEQVEESFSGGLVDHDYFLFL